MELLNINANVIYNIINLLILVVAFRILLFNKVDKIFEARKKDVDNQIKDASDDRIKAADLKREYEDKLAKQEAEKDKVMSEAREKGYAQYNEIITNAQKEADTIVEEARIRAKADAERERAKYLAELSDVVIDAAAKIAANSHTAESDSNLYDAFIDNAFDKGNDK
jgi:F-type H+-transporting ATPase subunit b